MKTQARERRVKAITLNFTQREFQSLQDQREKSTCPNMALYLRKRLFSRKIVTTFRNRSQDDILEELARNRMCLERMMEALEESPGQGPEAQSTRKALRQIEVNVTVQTGLVKKLLGLWLS